MLKITSSSSVCSSKPWNVTRDGNDIWWASQSGKVLLSGKLDLTELQTPVFASRCNLNLNILLRRKYTDKPHCSWNVIIWLWSGLRDVISLKCKSNLWGLVTFSMKKNQRFERSLPLAGFSRDPAKGFRNHLYFENKVDPTTLCKMRVMWLTDHASPPPLLTILVHPFFSWPNYTLLWNWGAISCYSQICTSEIQVKLMWE